MARVPFEAWGDFLDDGLNWEDRRSELIREEFLSGVQCMGYLRMMWSLAEGRMILLRMTGIHIANP